VISIGLQLRTSRSKSAHQYRIRRYQHSRTHAFIQITGSGKNYFDESISGTFRVFKSPVDVRSIFSEIAGSEGGCGVAQELHRSYFLQLSLSSRT